MKIEICDVCYGEGQLIDRDASYHRDEVRYKCDRCKGSGKLLKLSYEFKVPFDTDRDIIDKVSTEIFELIRNLKTK